MRRMYSENQLNKKAVEAVQDSIDHGNIDIYFFNIKDENGHQRFIEGDIQTENIEGVDFTYAKWSLSGTHLMIVLAGSISENTTIARNQLLGTIPVPDWVKNKIYTIKGIGITWEEFTVIDATWGTQKSSILLQKNENLIQLVQDANLECETQTEFRYSFDLLIDSD